MKICNYQFEEYIEKIRSFHGNVAPGMIVAGVMIDLAMKNLPKGEFFDVICESQHCIVDAVQMLTPCTIGNGWLKIVDTSRFSMTFYNKYTGEGIRVFVDTDKIRKWSEIKAWFLHEKPKADQDMDLLIKQIIEAGPGMLGIEGVQVKKEYLAGKHKENKMHAICPSCGEIYFKNLGDMCPACQGNGPYE